MHKALDIRPGCSVECDAQSVMFAGTDGDERAVKEATSATLRCFPIDQPSNVGTCFFTGKEAGTAMAIFAKAY